jgi:hypothetical protein
VLKLRLKEKSNELKVMLIAWKPVLDCTYLFIYWYTPVLLM